MMCHVVLGLGPPGPNLRSGQDLVPALHPFGGDGRLDAVELSRQRLLGAWLSEAAECIRDTICDPWQMLKDARLE